MIVFFAVSENCSEEAEVSKERLPNCSKDQEIAKKEIAFWKNVEDEEDDECDGSYHLNNVYDVARINEQFEKFNSTVRQSTTNIHELPSEFGICCFEKNPFF